MLIQIDKKLSICNSKNEKLSFLPIQFKKNVAYCNSKIENLMILLLQNKKNLINRGYKVYVGKTYKGEVDFVVTSLNKKCYIQVAYVLASKEIIEREFDAFRPIKDACPKYVFSLDRWDFSGDGICNINIVDFLLGKRDILLI